VAPGGTSPSSELHRAGEVRDGDHRVAPVCFSQVTKRYNSPISAFGGVACASVGSQLGLLALAEPEAPVCPIAFAGHQADPTTPARTDRVGAAAHLRTVSPSPIMLPLLKDNHEQSHDPS
jgi:hypothetical protein